MLGLDILSFLEHVISGDVGSILLLVCLIPLGYVALLILKWILRLAIVVCSMALVGLIVVFLFSLFV